MKQKQKTREAKKNGFLPSWVWWAILGIVVLLVVLTIFKPEITGNVVGAPRPPSFPK